MKFEKVTLLPDKTNQFINVLPGDIVRIWL